MVSKVKKTKKPKESSQPGRIVMKIPNPSGQDASFCAGCPGFCCSLYPELTVYDVFRLALSQGKPLPDYLILHYTREDDAIPVSISGKNVKMTLIHDGDKCIFFDEDSRLKCSVQDAKPGICLAYPFGYLPGGVIKSDQIPCPDANTARLKWTEEQNGIAADAKWELDRHMEIVADWNGMAGGKDLGEFLRFAAKEIEYEKTPWGSLVRKIRRVFRKR
jgi:Fe-S-cluster containining protein